MSECSFAPVQGSGGGVCRKHFRTLSADGRCDIGELVARAEAAEAEVGRLTAALAERDQRIEAAMEVCDQRGPDGTPFLTVWAKEVVQALRGG